MNVARAHAHTSPGKRDLVSRFSRQHVAPVEVDYSSGRLPALAQLLSFRNLAEVKEGQSSLIFLALHNHNSLQHHHLPRLAVMFAVEKPLARAASRALSPAAQLATFARGSRNLATAAPPPTQPGPISSRGLCTGPSLPGEARCRPDEAERSIDGFAAGDDAPSSRVRMGRTGEPRLPSYLKTSIPTGATFNKIKKDVRAGSQYCLRGGQVSQHWRVLGRRRRKGQGDCDDHAHGRYMHTRLPVLLRQDISNSRAAGRARAREHGRSHLTMGARLHCPDVRRPRRPRRRRLCPHCLDDLSHQEQVAPDPRRGLVPTFRAAPRTLTGWPRDGLDVFAHNVETVESRTPFVRDRRAKLPAESRGVAAGQASETGSHHKDEHHARVRRRGCRGGADAEGFARGKRRRRHVWPIYASDEAAMKVSEYVTPAKFEHWQQTAESLGFSTSPVVPSSVPLTRLRVLCE
ncbi:hypothetical protein L7F22_004700 [Adiantum nelumboides]|nr:hypothetical protein [Adiantum nelumboides]